MNWKLIFGLSLFGLAMALSTISVIPEGAVEMCCWIAIFIICAVIVARDAPGRYFLHGFLVSIFNCVWITSAHIIWSDTYLLHHAMEVANYKTMNDKMHLTLTQAMLIMGPVVGIISGLILGLFAFIASKLMKRPAVQA